MKPIKVQMNNNFLKKMEQYPKEDGWTFDWRSPTGCKFQDVRIDGTKDWLKMTPEDVYKFYKKDPKALVQLALIGNCLEWYSMCMIKNIYVEVWK